MDATQTAINLSPILTDLIQVLGGLLIVVLGWAGKKAADYFNLKQDDAARALIATAIANGVRYAESQLNEVTKRTNPSVNVSHPAIALAGNYAVTHVNDALTRLGITKEQLEQKIIAALPQ